MKRDSSGMEHCLTPANFNIRTRVHEYGGRCFALGNNHVYFSNFSDQRLYAQDLRSKGRPAPITPSDFSDGSQSLYADLQLTPDRCYLIFVWEHGYQDRENKNTLGALSLADDRPTTPAVLVEGRDFYANPAVSPEGDTLAWIQWCHPFMPWDQSELWVGKLMDDKGRLRVLNSRRIAGGLGQSVCQVAFGKDGILYFVLDGERRDDPVCDFWNLYKFQNNAVVRLTSAEAEYGYPHWVFGETRYVPLSTNCLLASRTSATGDELVLVDAEIGTEKVVLSEFQGYTQLSKADRGDDVLMLARSTKQEGVILRFQAGKKRMELCKPPNPMLTDQNISVAEPICFPTRDGATAYGYFYVPRNSQYQGLQGARPPLLVMVHGGPTSRCVPTLDVAKQYWTTIGFAVLDVNHRGSTGHGRAYRQALLGRWGDYDATDIVDAIEYLKAQELIDSAKVCIRGRSAGGYTTLRALTLFPEYFSAGACYFGIGNLVTLAETTHKFELHYTDGLLGEVFDSARARQMDSIYFQKSPIHHLDRLTSPLIVFQGLEDKVVLPSVSREMVSVLRQKGIDYEYIEYPGEGHGFRGSQTNIDALEREASFYIRVLRLTQC